MANPSTLYRFRIDLSDVDRGVYEALDLRVAMHPSETTQFLLTRVLAYALNFAEGLEFSPGGLSDVDAPAIRKPGEQNRLDLAIEIGNPSARKLHRIAKAAKAVKVYTYKDPDLLLEEMRANEVHRADEIEVYAFEPKFLDRLAATLARDNPWTVMLSDGELTVSSGDTSETFEIRRHLV
jgi:uncharacterized protein YaeQ